MSQSKFRRFLARRAALFVASATVVLCLCRYILLISVPEMHEKGFLVQRSSLIVVMTLPWVGLLIGIDFMATGLWKLQLRVNELENKGSESGQREKG